MAIYRGPGGAGDATADTTNQSEIAVTKAAEAAASATAAATSAGQAANSAASAASSATAAQTSANSAASSATAAAASVIEAQEVVDTIGTAVDDAETAAAEAAASASAAESAANDAVDSAALANDWATYTAGPVAGGEYSAKYHAQQAATSATNAANQVTLAAAQVGLAEDQVDLAAAQVSLATTQANNAANSATAAANSANAAAASFDSFDDRYLGAKATAPGTDNDGNALLTGALYWNTAANQLYVWDGAAWDAAAFSVSGAVTSFNTRTGNVTLNSTDVTNALTYTPVAPGANSNLTSLTGITGAIETADSVSFDTAATVTNAAGKVYWDDGNGTLAIGLKGGVSVLQVGQELIARVYNDSGVNLVDGQVVYISGAQGNRVAVKLANAASEATSAGTLGIVTEPITAGAEGFVTLMGTVNGLNTTGLTAGALLYLSASTPGAFTQTPPTAPNHKVVVGYVERVHAAAGSVYVKVDNGYELDELHNVLITSATNNDSLFYDGTKWVNKAPADARTALGLGTMATETATNYLTTSTAASTYLTQTNAASTYQTQAGMSAYLTTSAAASSYQPLDADLTAFAAKTAPTGAVVGTTDTQTLTNKVITGLNETRVAMPASNIDLSAGNYFTRTISGATTLTVSNVPASGTAASFILDLTNGGSATITWWSNVRWAAGTAPTLTSAGRDVLGFFTHDGGANWTGLVLGKDVK